MRCGRSRASLLWHSLLVSRGVPVPVCCGVPLPLSFLSGASYSAMVPLPAAPPRRPGQQHLCHCGAPASNFATAPQPVSSSAAAPVSSIFPMALCCSAQAGLQLRRGAQASNIFPMALCRIAPGQQLRHGAPASSSATAPLPATNLIRQRKVLRFG